MNHTARYEELRKAMREKGISQSDLARKLGVSQASISDVLRGRSSPDGKLSRALLAELELTPRQAPATPPRCPFMSSFPVRLAVSGQSLAKRLAEALMIAVIANLITK
ncbi:helix-turn-helix domain-containing protein [Pseudomonas sp. NY11955]|uniref:helix-turn-helix domain-containing protein n=1 Tax=Pseudomonas sp. NY11955 TaxID=3400363 RepID=UPI003A85EAC0